MHTHGHNLAEFRKAQGNALARLGAGPGQGKEDGSDPRGACTVVSRYDEASGVEGKLFIMIIYLFN